MLPNQVHAMLPGCCGGPPIKAESSELLPRSNTATKGLFSCRHTALHVFRHRNSLLLFLTLFFFSLPFSGYLVVPAGGGGTFLGGFLVNKFKLRCSGIIKLCLVCTLTSLMAIFVFFIRCPNVPMAGVTHPYTGR